MTQEEVIARVEGAREELALDDDLVCAGAERAVVEALADRSRPGVPEFRYAWVVSFACDWGRADVLVDDWTGEVIDVERSR